MIGVYIGFIASAIIESIRYNKLIDKSNFLTEEIKKHQKRI